MKSYSVFSQIELVAVFYGELFKFRVPEKSFSDNESFFVSDDGGGGIPIQKRGYARSVVGFHMRNNKVIGLFPV